MRNLATSCESKLPEAAAGENRVGGNGGRYHKFTREAMNVSFKLEQAAVDRPLRPKRPKTKKRRTGPSLSLSQPLKLTLQDCCSKPSCMIGNCNLAFASDFNTIASADSADVLRAVAISLTSKYLARSSIF